MFKLTSYGSRWMRCASRINSIGCLTAMLLVTFCEQPRTIAQAGMAPRNSGKLYVLSVGINAYPPASKIYSPHFAVADAQAVASAFSTPEVGNAFNGVEITTLADSAATLASVRSALEHLIFVTKPEDVVIFYFAGMGEMFGQPSNTNSTASIKSYYDFYLVDSSKDNNAMTARELSSLLLSIQARRQIIILDSVQSALAFESLRDALNADSIFTLRDAGRRFALLGIEGASNETEELGHGLLTYALLAGMKGAADTNHDGVITEAELEGYLMSSLQDLVQTRHQSDEQLLSYSDIRGLCLSYKPARSDSACDSNYGYDASIQTTEEERGIKLKAPAVPEQAETRGTDYALIVAGNTYIHWPKLENPIYDAQTLQRELIQNFGYSKGNVMYLENPTRRNIRDLLDEFQHRSFGKNDRLLIYIAGHGYMDYAGEGYLVTQETELPAEDPYLDSALNLSAFRSTVDRLPVAHILIVLDVCYGGSFKERNLTTPVSFTGNLDNQSVDGEIERKMESTSRLYIASGGLRQAFDGEPGRHSPFARTFLKTLREYGGQEHLIDMGKLDGAVGGLCPHPYYGTFGIQQEGGDFVFVPSNDPQKVPDPGLDAKVVGPRCSP